MAKTVDLQIRKVPARLRDRLRLRARSKGVTMSRYVIDLIDNDFERPTIDEWLAEVASYPDVHLPPGVTGASLVREAREERERELDARMGRISARRKRAR